MSHGKLGIAVVGLGGAVGTTMVAGVELLKQKLIGYEGLPLAKIAADGLAAYEDIVFAGWDLFGEHLAAAAEEHDVLTHKQFIAVEDILRQIKPWPAVGDPAFLSNVEGSNQVAKSSHRQSIEKIRADIRDLKPRCD
ncbi:MAG: inositol-3-phosphate synthase, partial [Acidobacteriota bacterium]